MDYPLLVMVCTVQPAVACKCMQLLGKQYACITSQQLSRLICSCMLWLLCLQATCRSAAGHLVSMMQ